MSLRKLKPGIQWGILRPIQRSIRRETPIGTNGVRSGNCLGTTSGQTRCLHTVANGGQLIQLAPSGGKRRIALQGRHKMLRSGLRLTPLLQQVTQIVKGCRMVMDRSKLLVAVAITAGVDQHGRNVVSVPGVLRLQLHCPSHGAESLVEHTAPRIAEPEIVENRCLPGVRLGGRLIELQS